MAQVERWAPAVRSSCARLDLTPCPVAQTLALIHLESRGDPRARKFPNSQFFGLLQMGAAAAREAGVHQARELHGDGERAILAHLRLRQRYQRRWRRLPALGPAIFWKGGPGSLRGVRQRLQRGDDLADAVAWASRHFGLPRLPRYLARYRAALQLYDKEPKP